MRPPRRKRCAPPLERSLFRLSSNIRLSSALIRLRTLRVKPASSGTSALAINPRPSSSRSQTAAARLPSETSAALRSAASSRRKLPSPSVDRAFLPSRPADPSFASDRSQPDWTGAPKPARRQAAADIDSQSLAADAAHPLGFQWAPQFAPASPQTATLSRPPYGRLPDKPVIPRHPADSRRL
jgi:hypothetical protein